MKTLAILGALMISVGAFAQNRPQVPAEKAAKAQVKQAEKEVKDKAAKGQELATEKRKEANDKMEDAKAEAKGKMDEAKEKMNNGNAYGKDKAEETGREFGQNRVAAAKAKAKEVKTEEEAEEMIETSKEETQKTVKSIDEKMVEARTKLSEKLASGEITQEEFDEKMEKLKEFEERKNSIIQSIN